MPLGVAILSFFGTELLVALTIQNLEIGFVPAIVVAVIAYCLITDRDQKLHHLMDNPPTEIYNLPVTQAYAVIKRTLKNFSYGEREWKIIYDEKSTYSLTAKSRWQDYSMKDHKILLPDGYLTRQIILQIALRRNNTTGLAELGIRWLVESPIGRGECDELQIYTTRAIQTALTETERGEYLWAD